MKTKKELINPDSSLFFHQLLAEDVIKAESALKKSNTGYAKRTYIRAVFSKIEGDISITKEMCMHRPDVVQEKLTAAEIAILNEEAYVLNDNGSVTVKIKHYPLIDNLLFAINLLAKINDYKPKIHKNNKAWSALKDAIKIRNRLTHPKRPKDIDIADEEIIKIQLAYLWTHYTFSYSHINLLRAYREIILQKLKSASKEYKPKKTKKKSKLAKIIEETDKLGKRLGID